MNSTVNGHPVIPRTGYIVEFNALWYNALRFIADLVREGGDVYLAGTGTQKRLSGSGRGLGEDSASDRVIGKRN